MNNYISNDSRLSFGVLQGSVMSNLNIENGHVFFMLTTENLFLRAQREARFFETPNMHLQL